MKPFYTRNGDNGTTGLLGDLRVEKSDLRIEVLGSLDELTATLGFARSLCPELINNDLKEIQIRVYEMMSEIAATPENAERFAKIKDQQVIELEAMIDRYAEITELPKAFILPGDCSASAALSVARTVTRRAERRLVELSSSGKAVRGILMQYINRLSSLLYILEIYIIKDHGDGTLSLVKEKDR